MERGERIELSALAWKAKVLPLYEPRILLCIPPAVIIVQEDMTLSYSPYVPSTRFPTGTVLALLAAFWFKDYHP